MWAAIQGERPLERRALPLKIHALEIFLREYKQQNFFLRGYRNQNFFQRNRHAPEIFYIILFYFILFIYLFLRIYTHQKFFQKRYTYHNLFIFGEDTCTKMFFFFERFMALRNRQHALEYLEELAALIHQTTKFEVEKEAILTRELCTHEQVSFR